MTAFLARHVYTGDGTTSQFAINFNYLSRGHVLLSVDGIYKPFTWINDGLIQATTVPAVGTVVVVERSSQRSAPLVTFQDAAVLTKADLDTSNHQAIYIAQEAMDVALNATAGVDIIAAANAAAASELAAAISAGTAVGAANNAANWATLTYGYMQSTYEYMLATESNANAANDDAIACAADAAAASASAAAALVSANNAAASAALAAGYATSALLKANNLSDLVSAPTARTNLGLGSASLESDTVFARVANNLSDLTNAGTARTNLGLGTAAVENVGYFATAAQGTLATNALPKSGGTMTGAILWSGAGINIQADWSTATLGDRMALQTSTVNANTAVGIIPNGSATQASLRTYNSSTPGTSAAFQTLGCSNTTSFIDSNVYGGATQLPWEVRIAASRAFAIDINKNVYLSGAALATNATNGFFYVPTCAGTPVGTPTAITGGLPFIMDSTNKIPYIWDGAAWAEIASAAKVTIPPYVGPPSPPGAGAVLTIDTLMGNRLTYTGTNGEQIPLAPLMGSRHIAAAIGIGNNSSSATYVGGALSSANGTNAGSGAQANTFISSFHWLSQYTSTAAINTLASASTNASCALGSVAGAGGFYFTIKMHVKTITSTGRAYIGLFAGAITGSTEPSAHVSHISLSADSADANMQMMHNDGSGTATKIDLGANFPKQSGEVYKLELYVDSNSTTVNYRVTRMGTSYVATGNFNTDLPAAGTALNPIQGLSTGPSSAASVVILAGEWYIETPY